MTMITSFIVGSQPVSAISINPAVSPPGNVSHTKSDLNPLGRHSLFSYCALNGWGRCLCLRTAGTNVADQLDSALRIWELDAATWNKAKAVMSGRSCAERDQDVRHSTSDHCLVLGSIVSGPLRDLATARWTGLTSNVNMPRP